MVEISAAEGSIQQYEQEFVANVFKLNDITVEDIMTPRIDVDVLNCETTIKDAIEVFAQPCPLARSRR